MQAVLTETTCTRIEASVTSVQLCALGGGCIKIQLWEGTMSQRAFRLLLHLSFVAFLATTAFAAKQYVEFRSDFKQDFGISSINRDAGPQVFSFQATPDIPQGDKYIDQRAMNRMGGILFLAVAKPSKDIAN